MRRTLGHIERQLFAYTQLRGLAVLRTRDLTGPLGLTDKQERELLSRLARAGLIAQIQRGLYLVPPRLPLGGRWLPEEAQVLEALLANREGSYQICGPNAFNRYGFDEQVPTRLYAYNDRISGERRVGALTFQLIKVATDRLGEIERVRTATGREAVYSSRVRTLVDAVYDWSRFNSLPRAYAWIDSELKSGRVSPTELVRVTLRYGDTGSVRRIGALLEQAGIASNLLAKLARALRPSTSFIAWNPAAPKRGSLDRRWGIVRNLDA